MRILLACPLHDPQHSSLTGNLFRVGALNDRVDFNASDPRRRILRFSDEFLVLHFVSQWACDAATMIGSPYYSLLPTWLVQNLRGAGKPVTVLSVNNGALLPELTSHDVRIMNAEPMSPSEFDALLYAADLVMTENRISVSLAKAISMLRPVAVLRNSRSVLDICTDGPPEAVAFAALMERMHVGSVFQFDVFPIWSRDDLQLLGIFDNSCLGGAYSEIEFFAGASAADKLTQLLTDNSARAQMRDAQLSYLQRIQTLPTGSEVLSLLGAARTVSTPNSV